MRRLLAGVIAAVIWGVLLAGRADAADLILRANARAQVDAICARYGFTLTASLDRHHVYLVEAPDTVTQATLDTILAHDRDVHSLEFSIAIQAPPVPGGPVLTQSIAPILDQSVAPILDRHQTTFLNYYGGSAWDSYVTQSAAQLIHVADAHALATGAGTIAIIDTGVDPYHPALQNALVEGYDFTRDLPGYGSEWDDVPNLMQSIAPILEAKLQQSVAPILDQSIAPILEGDSVPPALPPYFGHGTMVAGIVHLTAPTSKIMPLKAFSTDGSATLFNVIRAIYYAIDHRADVIHMSFTLTEASKELSTALKYAARQGAIQVAAVGNNGLSTDAQSVYPAAYRVTFGVGSTEGNTRSAFSNYGKDVTIGAPGEALVTIYPGGLYAAVSGTSFAAGWTSGAIGLFLERNAQVTIEHADHALAQGANRLRPEQGMGHGRIDVYNSTVAVTETIRLDDDED